MTVIELVERERAQLRRLIALGGAGLGAGLAALLLFAGAASLADARWIGMPRAVPIVVWLAAVAAVVAATVWTRRRIGRDASAVVVASAIERERELRAGALRGALEVAESGALGRRGAERLAAQLAAHGPALAPAQRRAARRRTGWLLAAATTAALVLGVTAVSFADGWQAVAHPVRAWRGTLLPPLQVDAPPAVLRGERAVVRLRAPGRQQVMLRARATGRAWTFSRHPVPGGNAQVTLPPADADVTLVLDDGRAASDTVVVRVTDRPFLADVALRAIYPAYLGRAEEPLAAGEVARVPRGTLVTVDGRASIALSSVELVRDTTIVRLRPDGQRFAGRMVATQSGTWHWRAAGAAGAIRDVPPPLTLEVIPDSAPRVEIVAPTRDTVVMAGDQVPVSIVASDDHGLAAVTLRSWRVLAQGSAQPEVAQRLVGADAEGQWTGDAAIDLAARGLEPGDALHVVAAAVDGSPWRQGGVSRELVLRLPSLSEQRVMARQAAESAATGAAALAGAQRQLQQRTSEVARSRGQRGSSPSSGSAQSSPSSASARSASNPLSFEAAEQAKALGSEQEALAQRVQEMEQQAKALERQLRQAGALDSGLAARLQEAQRLLADALTPQLAEQLQKLQEAAQQLEGDETRQALNDLAAQQQAIREQLERSVEMLRRAALEGAMETLRDEAQELAEKQKALADSMANSREQPRGARELAERSRDLTEDVSELAKRLQKEKAETGARKAAQAGEHAEQSADRMQQVARAEPPDDAARREQQTRDEQAREQQAREQQAGERRDAGERAASGDSTRGQPAAGERDSVRAENAGAADSAARAEAERRQAQAGEQGGPRRGERERTADARSTEQSTEQRSEPRDGQPQSGRRQSGAPQQGSQQQGDQQRSGRQQSGQQQGDRQAARDAAEEMQQAAQQLADARAAQVDEWKEELTTELDRSIQEMLQLSRQESALAEQAQQGGEKSNTSAEQSTVQQGVQQASQRLQKAGQKSSLVSSRSQRAVGEAQRKVEQAGKEASSGSSGSQTASAMREAAEALNRAAASLVRDRERANAASSASGFSEMLEEMQQLAKQQGQVNSQSSGLSMLPGGAGGSQAQAAARALARRQRSVAEALEAAGDGAGGDRAAQLAKEARQIAQALERGAPDPQTIDRQQRLYRRLLDAGKTLEQDERDESGKREARAATGTEVFSPGADKVEGKAATRFREPAWNELRGLTAEERRLVLEYFKRINADQP